MRRKDRERLDRNFMNEILARAEEMFVSFNDGDFPYILPVNFAHVDDRIYIHSALDGKKLDLIRKDGHVAFSAAIDIEIDRDKAETYYKSVCGSGMAVIVDDEVEKGAALDAIGIKYAAKCKRPSPAANIARVAIIKISILELTGKCCAPKP